MIKLDTGTGTWTWTCTPNSYPRQLACTNRLLLGRRRKLPSPHSLAFQPRKPIRHAYPGLQYIRTAQEASFLSNLGIDKVPNWVTFAWPFTRPIHEFHRDTSLLRPLSRVPIAQSLITLLELGIRDSGRWPQRGCIAMKLVNQTGKRPGKSDPIWDLINTQYERIQNASHQSPVTNHRQPIKVQASQQ